MFVVPGLINAHGHVGGTWTPGAMASSHGDHIAFRELERYARFGVTTVASLGGERGVLFDLRDASWGGEGAAAADDGALPRVRVRRREADDATLPETPTPPRARLLVAGPVVTGATPEEAVGRR